MKKNKFEHYQTKVALMKAIEKVQKTKKQIFDKFYDYYCEYEDLPKIIIAYQDDEIFSTIVEKHLRQAASDDSLLAYRSPNQDFSLLESNETFNYIREKLVKLEYLLCHIKELKKIIASAYYEIQTVSTKEKES